MATVRMRSTPVTDHKKDRKDSKDLRKISKRRLKYTIALSILLAASVTFNIIQYLNNY